MFMQHSRPRPCSSEENFELGRHLIALMTAVPFYSFLSRHMNKVQTLDVPTAMVAYDRELEEITLYVNPKYAAQQSNSQLRGLLYHEFDHVVDGHLLGEPIEDEYEELMRNLSQDLAINSLIKHNVPRPTNLKADEEWYALPHGGLIPGESLTSQASTNGQQLKDMLSTTFVTFNEIIKALPTMKSSLWYRQELEVRTREAGLSRDDILNLFKDKRRVGFDVHTWSRLTPEEREHVACRVRNIVEKAVKHADSLSNGWGDIPAEMRAAIRRSVSHVIDWRSVTEQFVGNLIRGRRRSSIKRINRRYPYVHAGLTKGYVAKLVIAVDMSMSVDDEMLASFFAELSQLTRNVDVSILPFDSECSESDVFEWRKGETPELVRTRCGGTNFDAPTRFVNSDENIGRWDGMLIMTDGEASPPGPSRIKRGWIIGKGHRLDFNTTDIVINMSDVKQPFGIWR